MATVHRFMTELQNCSGVPLRLELSTYINEMAKHVENIINVFKDEGSIPSGSTILNAYRIQNNVWIIALRAFIQTLNRGN